MTHTIPPVLEGDGEIGGVAPREKATLEGSAHLSRLPSAYIAEGISVAPTRGTTGGGERYRRSVTLGSLEFIEKGRPSRARAVTDCSQAGWRSDRNPNRSAV